MNVELLKKIKRRILREPQKFRMETWNCGTAQCIAGWACTMDRRVWIYDDLWDVWHLRNRADPERVGGRLLRLDREQRVRLFYRHNWPVSFLTRFQGARTRKQRAKIAAERIDHFIATNGAE